MRILIAEDDPATQFLLQHELMDWGYDVVVASNGAEAWEVLKRADAPPLALLDWLMPKMDGVDVCRKIRAESEAPFIYVVLLTGKTSRQDIIHGLESGADDYVAKPFDEQELQVRLRAGRRIVELHQRLLLQASRDSLTGVYNRKTIVEMLERELARGRRDGRPVSVVMADVDHFKHLNDTFGHLGGDAALREICQRMSQSMRPSDLIGRYGGEEFLIVLPACDREGARTAAERLRRVVWESEIPVGENLAPVTLSLGAASSINVSFDANALLRAADDALYRAKHSGRNRVETHGSKNEPAKFSSDGRDAAPTS
ncbi:MAG TPA: diguanylate cyclase [Pirellulales bacterium]